MRRDQMGSQNPNSELESCYTDSVSSSPRSVGRGRGTDSEYSAASSQRWDDSSSRVRFMCSFGGKILPRPHDNQLRYVGGDTRIVAVNRNISYSVLIGKLSRLSGSAVTLKYQLPNEDLDALISVTTDEDLDNMMEEYDRLQHLGNKSSRMRLFLFPATIESATSLGSLLDGSKREHWFVDALNGAPLLARGRSEVSSVVSEMPDYLFGLDNIEDWERDDRSSHKGMVNAPVVSAPVRKTRMSANPQEGMNQQSPEVHSAPGSPMPDSSPYGSASSAPPCMNSHVVSVADLAPVVKVKSTQGLVDDAGDLQQRYDTAPSDGGFDSHNGQDALRPPSNSSVDSAGVQEIGLRTQDPRLIFDDHMIKINHFQGKPSTNNPTERAKNRLNSPEGERHIPVQEFQQVQIASKHQPENLRPDDVEEHTRYDSPRNPVNPVSEDPEGSQSSLRNEGSQSDLVGLKREGSGLNLSASGDEIRNMPKQDEVNPITAKKDRKNPDVGIKVIPSPQKPVLERRMAEEEVRSDQIYCIQKPEVTMNTTAEHYVALPQEHHATHFVQAGQTVYWQAHDSQLQQGEQAIPIYLVSAAAAGASPVLQTVAASVRPTGQTAYMPVQRMGISAMNAPAVYSGDVLPSKPVNAVQAQMQRPTNEIPPKVVGVPGPGKIPMYRARAVPAPSDVRMIMRPPQPVASPMMQITPDQYAYQQVVYETNPTQVYYTQKAAPIVNPPYQGLMPASADLQATSEMLLDQPKLTKVSQSL